MITPNKQQLKNLTRLANYLAKLPDDYEHFYMGDFLNQELDGLRLKDYKATVSQCGTVACALGHAPIALGRKPLVSQGPSWLDPDWEGIAVEWFGLPFGQTGGLFSFLFSGTWADEDPTPRGAAERIRLAVSLIECGKPRPPLGWHYSQYRTGWWEATPAETVAAEQTVTAGK